MEAILRPVRSDLSARSAASRELERVAGPLLEHRLLEIGETPAGAALITPAEQLPATFVVHVVLEGADDPPSAALLTRALENALRRAEEWEVTSLALPPLGAGAGGLDPHEDARITLPMLLEALQRSEHLSEILVVVANDAEEAAFRTQSEGLETT